MSRRFPLLRLLMVLAVLVGGAACGGDDGKKETSSESTLFDIGGDDKSDDTSSKDRKGAAGDADPEEWATAVCGAMTGWLHQIQDLGTQLGTDVGQASGPEEAKGLLVTFLGDAVTATDDLIGEIKDADAPDVKDGEAVAAALKVGLNRARTIFDDARQQAEQIPTDDPDAFQAAVTEIQSSIEEGSTELGDTFDRLSKEFDVPELDRAFNELPACKELETTSSGASSSG